MSQFLRTLWSPATCEFCGTRHSLGVCPLCGASRTIGEHKFIESPHIEKLRAMKEVVLRYKAEEQIRIDNMKRYPVVGTLKFVYNATDSYEISAKNVKLNSEQTRILDYIMLIVNELTGQDFKTGIYGRNYIAVMQREKQTQMLHYLNGMLTYLNSALDVEEKLADVVIIQNGGN